MTETSDMVEKVARAIDPVAWKWLDTAPAEHPAREPTIAVQIRQARAALEAMRDALTNPTDEMKAAFSDAEDSNDHPVEYYLNTRRLGAMIDSALSHRSREG